MLNKNKKHNLGKKKKFVNDMCVHGEKTATNNNNNNEVIKNQLILWNKCKKKTYTFHKTPLIF